MQFGVKWKLVEITNLMSTYRAMPCWEWSEKNDGEQAMFCEQQRAESKFHSILIEMNTIW